jgi:L-fuconolactonase
MTTNLTLDAHQHFWRFDPVRDAWISEKMQVIRRDFLPSDLKPLLAQNGIAGCVAVQADQSEEETRFLLDLAEKKPFVEAVVGWTDLRSGDIEERLEHWRQFPRLRGFRHILQAEKPEFMLDSSFLRGIKALEKMGFAYDILVFPKHLPALKQFLKKTFERQKFVLDHLAKPYIKRGLFKQWKTDITAIARHENVCCKLSGMVTEADWRNWKASDFRPYIDIALETFGVERLMYGSDWPVCLLAASYGEQKAVLDEYFEAFSDGEKEQIFGGNARRFYGIL